MHKYFIAIHYFVQKNKVLSIGIAFCFLFIFGYFTSRIHFEEDITRIIPKNEQADITAKVLQQLNFADKITVIIEKEKNGSLDDMSELAHAFLDSVQTCKEYIKDIQGKIDGENIQETFDFVYANLPLFLDSADYKVIEKKLNPDSIIQQVQGNYRTLISPTGLVARDFILNDPMGISFIALKKLQQLNIGDEFHLQNGFVTTKDDSKILLFINPVLSGSETEKNTLFAAQLEKIKSAINQQFKGKASIDYFGSSLIAVANAKQIKHDIFTTVMISTTALMLILILFYRRIFIPLIIFIPTIFGGLFALASLYFLKESISAISLSIGAVLVGVTIDYALHILTHYKHRVDVHTLYKDITMPLIMSSTTTAAAFLCLLFVNSEALQDLGIFAAISVVVSAIFSLLIIPHLYTPAENPENERETVIDKAAGFSFHNNKFLLISCLICIVVCFFTFQNVGFNNNLSELNFIPKEIKNAEAKVEGTTNLTSKSIYLASYGNSENEALENNRKLYRKLTIEQEKEALLNFSSIGGIVLSQEAQEAKIAQWNTFWSNARKKALENELIAAGNTIGFKPETHQQFYTLLHKDFQPVTLKDYQKIKALPLNDFVADKNGFYTVLSIAKVSNEQRDVFVKHISKEKNVIVIDRQHMNETFLGKLKDDFNTLVNYSFVAVILILFIFFRKTELVIIATIPIAITGVVTAGIMAIFGIELNIFSTIVCTLIFGHGVDFSIFMTSALQKEYTFGKIEMKTYRTSILLAVMTTILAIGALIFAKHPALKSISIVSLIGVFAALIITFVFYPVLFRICISNRVKKGKSPVTLRLFLHSTLSFIYYGLGGILLSVFGQLVLKVFPGNKHKKMLFYRKTMSVFMKSVLYTNPFLKKCVLNPFKENFDKPAVIISNHTSFLDTLAIGMLSPKIIFLVNDWVYNSPIFGRAVKLAGFYPVSQGLDGGVEHLRKKVEEGYSLMVFPEGTRSEDNSIKRFHKGAFFLAQELALDILPIYIHGNSETLPKGDNIIYSEKITVKVDRRILFSDDSFGTTYDVRTKKISRYFKENFQQLRNELEDETYFQQKLFLSFLYKEYDIEKIMKQDFNQHKSLYFRLSKTIASDARILHIADDYGQIDVLLTFNEAKRKINSFITNEEKRGIANTNYIVQKRMIEYIDSESEMHPKTDTLIVSNQTYPEKISTAHLQFKTVVLLHNQRLKNDFVKNGFEIQTEGTDLIVLKKKD